MLLLVCLMVFNATFNNISVILWWSVLLEETGGPRENQRPVASHYQTLEESYGLLNQGDGGQYSANISKN
jgi:hypothetical protein